MKTFFDPNAESGHRGEVLGGLPEADRRVSFEPKSLQANTGYEILYLVIGLPAAYILKKLADEAVKRFAKWVVDKASVLWMKQKTDEDALIISLETTLGDGGTFKAVELRIDGLGSHIDHPDLLNQRILAIIQFVLSEASHDRLARNWICELSEESKSWRLIGKPTRFDVVTDTLQTQPLPNASHMQERIDNACRVAIPISLPKIGDAK